jgi:hypothetical protein
MTSSDVAIDARPQGLEWFHAWVDLQLRPESFFSGPGRRIPMMAPIYLLGVAGVMDRMEVALMGLSARPDATEFGWAQYWLAAAVGGLVAGPLHWWIGGWWVGVRARFCGAPGVDRDLCRRISVLTGCIFALPAIGWMGASTWIWDTPQAYSTGEDVSFITMLLVIAWSVWISYRAVVAHMPVRRGRARFWSPEADPRPEKSPLSAPCPANR